MRKRTYSINYDPLDDFMEKNNLYRKQLPRDGTCLFRAAAEQFSLNQNNHLEMRELCINYLCLYKKQFQSIVEEDIEIHIEKMKNPLTHGGLPELIALSQIYKCDYVLYAQLSLQHYMTFYKSKKPWILYMDASEHFDLLYPKKYCKKAGYCQALLYEILYTHVLKMKDVMDIVDQMLHNSNSSYRNDSCTSNEMQEIMLMVEQTKKLDIKYEENINNSDYANSPPFPYRVAKALDPDVYRNIEYDAWKVLKREAKYGPYDKKGLQIGVKVQVKLNTTGKSQEFTEFQKIVDNCIPFVRDSLCGYIQSMTEDQGPVTVYAEELGKIIKVPYQALEKITVSNGIYSSFQDQKGYGSTYPHRRLTSVSSSYNSNPPSPKVNKSFDLPVNVSEGESKMKEVNEGNEVFDCPHLKETDETDFCERVDAMQNNPYPTNTSLCMYGGYNEPLCMPYGSIGTAPVIYPAEHHMMGPICNYQPNYLCQQEFQNYPCCPYTQPYYGSYQPYPYYVYYGSPYYDYSSSVGEVQYVDFTTETYTGYDNTQHSSKEGVKRLKNSAEYISNRNLEGQPLIKI